MGIISPGSPGMYEEQFYKTLGKYSEYCDLQRALVRPEAPS